ncbi:hypothetical protein BDR22DRAFT_898639 [Usnea florida]
MDLYGVLSNPVLVILSLNIEQPLRPPPQPHGPPYAPTTAGLGGLPTVQLDVPITSVFMALFLLGAASHFTLLQLNKRRGHKFNMSGAMFGFSMARVTACMLRIVWATHPKNTSLAIAASLFVAVGDLLGSVVNLNFTHRIIRALHPSIGWSKPVTWAFASFYVLIVVSVILLISFSVESYYTLNPSRLHTAHHVLLYGSTYFATAAFLPIPLLLATLLKPRTSRAENFGRYGTMRSKVLITLWGAILLALGAWFRAGTGYLKPRPATHPAWYQSKACFYIFYFTIEITVIYSYFFLRIDQRFHVPDGANGPGEYSGAVEARHPDGTMWNSSEERVVSPMASFEDRRLEPKVLTLRALAA